MSYVENNAAGAGLAAFHLQASILQLLILHKVLPQRLVLEIVDTSLQHLERLQMAAEAQGIPSLAAEYRASRHHIQLLLSQLQQMKTDE